MFAVSNSRLRYFAPLEFGCLKSLAIYKHCAPPEPLRDSGDPTSSTAPRTAQLQIRRHHISSGHEEKFSRRCL